MYIDMPYDYDPKFSGFAAVIERNAYLKSINKLTDARRDSDFPLALSNIRPYVANIATEKNIDVPIDFMNNLENIIETIIYSKDDGSTIYIDLMCIYNSIKTLHE